MPFYSRHLSWSVYYPTVSKHEHGLEALADPYKHKHQGRGSDGFICSVCRGLFRNGIISAHCACCEYDECPACYLKNPKSMSSQFIPVSSNPFFVTHIFEITPSLCSTQLCCFFILIPSSPPRIHTPIVTVIRGFVIVARHIPLTLRKWRGIVRSAVMMNVMNVERKPWPKVWRWAVIGVIISSLMA